MKIKQLNRNGKTLSIENSDLLTQDKNVVYLNTVVQATSYVGNDGDVFIYDSTEI